MQSHKFRLFGWALCLLWTVMSCATSPKPLLTQLPTKVTITHEQLPSSKTPIAPNFSPAPTLLPQEATRAVQVTYLNISVETELPRDYPVTGILALGENDGGVLVSLPDMKRLPLPDWNINREGVYVSPNRQSLAYMSGGPHGNRVNVVNASGQQLFALDLPQAEITGWVNDQWLHVTHSFPLLSGTVFVVNPWTGAQKEVLHTFPQISEYSFEGFLPFVVYDPLFSRAIYLTEDNNSRDNANEEIKKNWIQLWDMQNNQVLWQKYIPVWSIRKPVWSPDGEYFAVILTPEGSKYPDPNSELYIVDRNGNEILHIEKAYNSVSWSPDQNYIASGDVLSVLNVDTRNLTIYNFEIDVRKCVNYPIWSPDGHYITFINTTPGPHGDTARVILLDLLENRAFEIARNVITISGWMAKP
jgi:hypothetical protein